MAVVLDIYGRSWYHLFKLLSRGTAAILISRQSNKWVGSIDIINCLEIWQINCKLSCGGWRIFSILFAWALMALSGRQDEVWYAQLMLTVTECTLWSYRLPRSSVGLRRNGILPRSRSVSLANNKQYSENKRMEKRTRRSYRSIDVM